MSNSSQTLNSTSNTSSTTYCDCTGSILSGKISTIDTDSATTASTYSSAYSNLVVGSGSIGSTTTNTNGITWTTAQPSVAYGSAYNLGGSVYGYFDDKLTTIISLLKESEIEELLDKIIERSSDTNDIKIIIKNIISSRHFSEDFLLKYFEYVDDSIVRIQHSADIKSQEYDRLALLIEASK